MQETLSSNTQLFHPTKTLTTILLAASITFVLFVIMDKLTQIEGEYVQPAPIIPLYDVVLEDRKEIQPEKVRIKPVQKPIPPPDSLTKLELLTPDSDNPIVEYQPDLPDTTLARSDMNAFSMNEGQATPVFRTSPKYPAVALREGIEGWVKLIFTIDSAGQVKNIKVIESEPERIFDREAKRALARWKYQPQLVDGKPTEQTGMQVVLDFRLDS